MEYLERRPTQMWKNLLVKSSTGNCWRIVESEDSHNQKQKVGTISLLQLSFYNLITVDVTYCGNDLVCSSTWFQLKYTSEISITHRKIYNVLIWNCSDLCLTGFWLSLLHPLYLPLLKSMENPSTHKLLTLKEHCTLVAGIPRTFHLAFILSLWEFK